MTKRVSHWLAKPEIDSHDAENTLLYFILVYYSTFGINGVFSDVRFQKIINHKECQRME